MTVHKISFKSGLTFELDKSPEIATRLLPRDKNGDGVFSFEDVHLSDAAYEQTGFSKFMLSAGFFTPEGVREAEFEQAVIDSFEDAREITAKQRRYVQKFFDLYPRVKKLSQEMEQWRHEVVSYGAAYRHSNNATRYGMEWEFDGPAFNRINKAISEGKSALSNRPEHAEEHAGYSLAFDMGVTAYGLSDGELDDPKKFELPNNGGLGGVVYDPARVPVVMREQFYALAAQYAAEASSAMSQLECVNICRGDISEIRVMFILLRLGEEAGYLGTSNF